MDDKIDVHNLEKQYENFKEKISKSTTLNIKNKETILKYLRDSELGKTILKGQKRTIGAGRNVRVAGILLQFDAYFKRPFEDITSKEMEDLIYSLDKGTYLSSHGKSYSSESKKTMKKFVKKFWKWLKGNNQVYPDEVSWIDTTGADAEIKAISREEMEKMVDLATDYMTKALVMVLFDSGARESELLNVRLRDVTKDNDTEGDYCYYINIRHSKTKARKISVKISTPLLDKYLTTREDINNPQAQLFPLKRANMYNKIKRLAEKAIAKSVSVQMMRHASATYYASRVDNRASFCYRYGWAYSSDMPDRYIDWSKIHEKQTVQAIKIDEVSGIKKENERLKEQLHLVKEQLKDISKDIDSRKQLDWALNKLLKMPEIQEIIKEKI